MQGILKKKAKDAATGKLKGFGFISCDGRDVFVHASAFDGGYQTFDSLNEGENGAVISFEIGQGKDGKEAAINAVVISN